MADREREIGAVHRIKVQFLDAVVDEVDRLLDEPRRRRGGGVVLEAVEPAASNSCRRGLSNVENVQWPLSTYGNLAEIKGNSRTPAGNLGRD